MNKRISNFLAEKNFTIDSECAYGIFNGYEVTIGEQGYYLDCAFTVCGRDDRIFDFCNDLNKRNLGVFLFSKYNQIFIRFKIWTYNSLFSVFEERLNLITNLFKKYDFKGVGYCPICGCELRNEEAIVTSEGRVRFKVHSNCLQDYQSKKQFEDEMRKAQMNNGSYLKGFIGAFLGGLIGIVCYIILGMINLISSLSASLAVLVGSILYKKLGGKCNKNMLVIVGLTTFVMMILCTVGIYMYYGLVFEGSNCSVFEAFEKLMSYTKFRVSFIKELLFQVLFTVIGIVCQIINQKRKGNM